MSGAGRMAGAAADGQGFDGPPADGAPAGDQPADGVRSDGVIEVVGGDERTIVLTFDDGPNPPDTTDLLDLLAREDVPAVFFLVGERVVEHPDLVARIAADGHVLGNHSWRHDDLGDASPDVVHADLTRTLDAIRDAVPGAPVPYWRAPFGSWGATVDVAAGLGMRSMGWHTAVEDWVPPGVDELVRRMEAVAPGGVILLHDGGGDRSQTVAAVARFVPLMRERGWQFVAPPHA
ncbi:polysaccharide deacetylase family protein [Cellulomonas sp. FA1]|uniref:polysaccharide deacetylase family protein n=1 Tax=Cellulomonas sp. FA1 TaxID=1346710 RepID=UPI000B1AEDE8|nr:polysaccharide deacetylase family protein [Cellulomonas sp. FA1]